MTKQGDRGRLRVRSERLRRLTGLSQGDLGRVAGGTMVNATMIDTADMPGSAGRVYSRTCCYL
jgi:hypothetical protein